MQANTFQELVVKFSPWEQDAVEQMIAKLAEQNVDNFWEDEPVLKIYLPTTADVASVKELVANAPNASIESDEKLADINWNEEWEKNFSPVEVADKLIIRADFHKIEKTYPIEIIINPKMSFGTGHHATTHLVAEEMLNHNYDGQAVLDMGCGTGVLAILSEKLGAVEALAIDNNPWAVENSEENVTRNGCSTIVVSQDEADNLPEEKFDTILANINRNVLLVQGEAYFRSLKVGGTLLISGILIEDQPLIQDHFEKLGFSFIKSAARDKWCMLRFKK